MADRRANGDKEAGGRSGRDNPGKGESRKVRLLRFIKFTLFSASAGLIEVAVFTLLSELAQLPYWPSYLVALLLSVLWNYTLNRRYTFRSAASVPKAMALVLLYYGIFTPLSTWWGDALTVAGWNEYVVLGGTMLVNFVTEFLYQRYVVFRRSIDTRPRKAKR